MRRVRRRHRTGRAAVVAVLAVVVLGAIAIVALQDDDGRGAVAVEPTTPGHWAAFGPTALAIVVDQVWVGGDGYVALGDGTNRVDLRGPVAALAAGDDGLLWVRGERFVAAVDTSAGRILGTWEGDAADLAPLPSGHVAITSRDADEVVIVRTAAEGLEELSRIPTHDEPTNIVPTTSGDVWVNESGGTIALVDVGAGAVAERCSWGGPLLAPALDGTIWTTDGSRLVSLDTAILRTGALSAALGPRYDVDASMVVETTFGVFAGGPTGIIRFSAQTPDGEVVTSDEPSAMDESGGQVAYVAGGEVHTAMAKGDSAVP